MERPAVERPDHEHGSLNPLHWTERPLRRHLVRDRDGHGQHEGILATWTKGALLELHASYHPEHGGG